MENTKTTQKRWTQNHRLKPHGKQYNHTPTDQRVWKVRHNLLVNAETHNSGNNVPSGERESLSEAQRDGFVCFMWDCNYRVSAHVLMVYCRMVGMSISLKRKRTGHWWKLKTSLHGSWKEERVECENFSCWRECTVLCFCFVGQRLVNSTVQCNTFCVLCSSQWSTCTRTYVLMKRCVFAHFSWDFLRFSWLFARLLAAIVAMGPTPIKMQMWNAHSKRRIQM